MLNKKEVTERLCKLVTKVGSEQFKSEFSHDCFCGESLINNNSNTFVNDVIIEFIEKAVEEKMEKEKE